MTCKKVVYEDAGHSKVIKGEITRDEEFTIDVKTVQGNTVTIGKRAIVQITVAGDER